MSYHTNWVQVSTDAGTYFWNRADNVTVWVMRSGVLPLWVAKESKSKGMHYYINQSTQQTVWDLPEVPKEEVILKPQEKEQLMKAFMKWDTDRSGSIDVKELGGVLKALGIPAADCEAIFAAADRNSDGGVDYLEFIDWIMKSAPRSAYYKVFCTLQVEVKDKRSGTCLNREIKVQATDKVATLSTQLGLHPSEKCRLFFGEKELVPVTKSFADFGIKEGDKVSALIQKMAPHMQEFFKNLRVIAERDLKTAIDNPLAELALALDAQRLHSHNLNLEEERRQKLAPFVEKSFDHHDTKKNGTHDRMESTVFIGQYIANQADFTICLAELVAKAGFDRSMATRGDMSPDKKQILERQGGEILQSMVTYLHQYFEDQKSKYLKNQKAGDAGAFRILDANGDGCLQKKEVVAALMPNTTRNNELLKAMGFDIDEATQMVIRRIQHKIDDGK